MVLVVLVVVVVLVVLVVLVALLALLAQQTLQHCLLLTLLAWRCCGGAAVFGGLGCGRGSPAGVAGDGVWVGGGAAPAMGPR